MISTFYNAWNAFIPLLIFSFFPSHLVLKESHFGKEIKCPLPFLLHEHNFEFASQSKLIFVKFPLFVILRLGHISISYKIFSNVTIKNLLTTTNTSNKVTN